MRAALAALLTVMLAAPLFAQDVADLEPREGWAVHATAYSFDVLVERTREAIRDGGLAVVTQAGPTGAAANRGIEIPGNRIIGAFNNQYAVRILRLSTAAMIEAPLRFYVTENTDGSATLSYKLPSEVFAPYMDAGGPDLAAAAAELDAIFAEIAAVAQGQ